ncbi:hypothetical protein Daura_06040 [Dactylosporangium aurantiacum]|uniref:Uncharacterized protein n=1 Tax=Dactylosporangium aurantiacum TaxID=35754 RepID=A0A9Q9IHM7_9ACTN|nr:hypothetical protein [Dactylosporangium aurantiacum]UWZ55761.1 hypothetical protein Daura_06040 [Dactylosporangium aurantiacum]
MPEEWMLHLLLALVVVGVRGVLVIVRQEIQQRGAERLLKLLKLGGPDMKIVMRNGGARWSVEFTSIDAPAALGRRHGAGPEKPQEVQDRAVESSAEPTRAAAGKGRQHKGAGAQRRRGGADGRH